MVEKGRKEVEDMIREGGEEGRLEINVDKMDGELVKIVGGLNYGTSYGENVLKH
uniref:hypothetical protein n=1 Tax=Staphylococcus warneri TaxID=1292 RepID=UPI00164310D7|nr:hypothetical protein [Staphylococcus warneri]